MKIKLFSFYDSKVKAFRFPFLMNSSAEALRGLQQVVNDGKSDICRYAEDFSLFEHGEFDDQIGVFVPLKSANNLGLASNFKVSVAVGQDSRVPVFTKEV